MPQEKAKQLYQFLIYSVIFGLKKVPIVGAAVELAVDWQNNVKVQLNQQANLKVQERLAQIEQAMLCLPDEVRKMAQEMIAEQRRLGVDISPEQEEAVLDLASSMPAAIRERTQATLRQARQHGTALHTVLPVGEQVSTQERAEFYQSLLPARRSAFRENDWVPHRNPPWQLVQLLGAGGFGEVWEARHPQLNDRFAVKFCQDEASAKVLKQEATALFRLRKELPEHPNIVRLLDLQLDKEPYWLAFEYVPGGTLEALMRGASLTWQEVLAIFLPIVEGMSAVHKVGIVHRDLKPANILLTEAGVPKITDFGIGKVMVEQERTRLLLSRSLTMASFGSAGYASPEQIKGLPAHPTDDTYALGALLWQLVTHKLQPPQYVQRNLREANIPDVVKALIIDCLENPRDERPQRAEELLKVLQPLVSVTGDTARHKAEEEAKLLARRKAEEEAQKANVAEVLARRKVELAQRKVEAEAKKAAEKEQQTKHIALTLRELSAFNPLDWWRLLVWVLWSPQHLKVHREILGRDQEQYVGSCLVSTLIWLPLLWPTLGMALEWIPPDDRLSVVYYWMAVGVIGIAWLLTGIFALANNKVAGIVVGVIAGVMAGVMAGEMAGEMAGGVTLRMVFMFNDVENGLTVVKNVVGGVACVVTLIMAEGVAFGVTFSVARVVVLGIVLSVVLGMVLGGVLGIVVVYLMMAAVMAAVAVSIAASLKTGEPSIIARTAFIALLLSNAFILWFSLLGGWQMFFDK